MKIVLRACVCAILALPLSAAAKPIAYADGTSLMFEYGAGTMEEAQAFYAPSYRWSAGAGHLRLDAADGRFHRDISYVRTNRLLKRWNLPAAQGNVFAWGGLGGARSSDHPGTALTVNAGAQADYETRRIYSSLKTELQSSRDFTHRFDTVQLGLAPYEHDYDTVATWLVLQARNTTGDLYAGIEYAALLRLFKGKVWVEAGVTQDGKLQMMSMFNF